jgi:Cys-tRNA(Pro)/Cys-tRNA(Cys) deacylase
MEMLREAGTAFTLHEHPPVRTIDEARVVAPHLTRNLLKTVVFKIKEGPWILASVPGRARIDYRGLAAAFGVKRTDLRTVSPQEVEDSLGFEVGGVGPFAIREDVEVVLDESLSDLQSIFCGSGLNTRTIEMPIRALAALPRTRLNPIIRSS